MKVLAWIMLVSSIVGLAVTMPLWLLDLISDRMMIGVTLALSWLALLYEGVNAVHLTRQDDTG